jgi:DNA ligase-1
MIQEWIVEVEGDRYRTAYGYHNGVKTVTEWTVVSPKNEGRTNATTGAEQAAKEAQALWDKKVRTGFTPELLNAGKAPYVEPMLAENWEDYRSVFSTPPVLYSQPKLDGIRCIVKKDGMFSRTGKPILSAPHIRAALQPVFDRTPDIILDGELYNHELKDNFNQIVSLVRKTKPTAQDLADSAAVIEYWIYDVVDTTKYFSTRLEEFVNTYAVWPTYSDLRFESRHSKMENIKIVETGIVRSSEHLDHLYRLYVKHGFEGQMIRLDGPYEHKRSKNLLKRKEFVDIELPILDIVEGNGNRTGMAGYMVFELEGKRFHSNVKGPHEYLAKVLAERNSLIGKTATIQFFNLTPDGIPRFPYVININREQYE